MSVILDALRRARGSAPARPSITRLVEIPAGLRIGNRGKAAKSKADGTRWGLLGGVVAAAVVLFVAVQFALPVLQRRVSAPRVVATTGTREAPPQAPATPPLTAASSSGAPTSSPTESAQPTAAPAEPPAAPGITEMLDKINAPPVLAPRAMPGARPSAAIAAPPLAPTVVRRAPLRAVARTPPAPPVPAPLPVPVEPAPPLTTPTALAAPAASGVNHFDLAKRYQSIGNFEQALAHYSAVLQEQEFNAEARNNLGLLYLDRGLTNEAIDQFRRAILINPDYLKARSNLGVALMNAGRLDEARAEFRAGLAAAPRNVELLVNQALVEKASHQPEAAKEILLRALGYQPTHAAAHYNLAVLFDEVGDTANAYDHYSDFLKNAGPEFGARISDVRRRLDAIAPRLDAVR